MLKHSSGVELPFA